MTQHKPEPQQAGAANPSDPLGEIMGQAAQQGSTAQAHAAPQPDEAQDAAAAAQSFAEALAKSQAEASELKDKLLRTLAEMENLRRRTEKEVADSRAYGISNFARDMLGFADNLRRAVEAVPVEARTAEGPLKAFVEGVELTERDFVATLARHGVRPIDPKGQKFDPNLHQAMFEAQNPDLPSGTVMEVLQIGYAIGERVLRPALVGVARGGPKAAAEGASVDKTA